MKIILLSISTALLLAPIHANEMTTVGWNFPTADMLQVSQNRQVLFCQANPSKCPSGLRKKHGSKTGNGSALADTKASSSANNISVVLAGDNSSVTLSTSQDAKDNSISSDAEMDAVIDYDQVLNYNEQ